MSPIKPESVWNLRDEELLNLLQKRAFRALHHEVNFYAPDFTHYKSKYFHQLPNSFPTISLTGDFCSLNCKHCEAKVLKTMHPAVTPDRLFKLCSDLKQKGANGCLISGGCLPNGSVPIDQFIDVLKKVKCELGLTIFVHSGLISALSAYKLKQIGVDAVLIDVIGSRKAAKEICNLDVNLQDYEDSLEALEKSGLPFVPHIVVGLNDGRLDGEFDALKTVRKVTPSALVIIAFMPIHGTVMAKTVPPKPLDIARVVATARIMFPKTPLLLGCMRPKGKLRSQIDILALQAGADAVAFPTDEAIEFVMSQNRPFSFSSSCCAELKSKAKG